ncbi:NnrU family protein [Vannielia litorea]|uniref:NnrU family protein n=1 Tax=Vannielia litorea TaxID=1217970 RepID=UPI001BD121DA|nr:NnrU family protein [Vannielia litorea]MBS8226446.1 NnrU family protein [Vannielia litorea]
MTGWAEYALALVVFIASHFLPRLGGLRERLIAALGRRAYFSLYGLLSTALLVWLVSAAVRAPYVELWPQLPWARWVPNIAMPLAVCLVTCGIGLRQPYTLGGRRGVALDPAQPGFAAISRHPLFLALALWAGAHLFPNGDLAMVLLFGSFTLMALLAIPAFDARARRALGADATPFFGSTALMSLRPLARAGWRRRNGRALALRLAAGLALWLALLHLHAAVIGASPFPL